VRAPLVSVVIPFHDAGAYLAEAVESALAQTHDRLELILVDDGSSDDGPTVARRYAGRATLVRQARGGAGPARNAGLRVARGELVAFLDADDLWAPEKVARQVAALAADPGLDAVMTMVEEFLSPELDPASAPLRPAPGPMAGAIPSALMIRRSAADRLGPFSDAPMGEWADWYRRLADAGMRATTLDEVLVRRRLHLTNSGRLHRADRTAYLRALKASLDRRREASA
jgi:glycosyltransferase involved in cell wall biosynthesis